MKGGSHALPFTSIPGRGKSKESRNKGTRGFHRTLGRPEWLQQRESASEEFRVKCDPTPVFLLVVASSLPPFSQTFLLSFCTVPNVVSWLNSSRNEAN